MYEVEWAAISTEAPSFAGRGAKRGRRRQGVLYERKVHAHFQERFAERWLPSPWFRYRTRGDDRLRWCQPDALLFDLERGLITIIEVKFQHTAGAWEQLRIKYPPVVEAVFPRHLWDLAYCEVVRWYDPAASFPERVSLIRDPSTLRPGQLGVYIHKPE